MNKIILFVSSCFFGVFVSCHSSDSKMEDFLTGTWETILLKSEINSYQGRDASVSYTVNFEDENDAKAKIMSKTITEYAADGTFTSWQMQGTKKLVGDLKGKWEVRNDSLYYTLNEGTQLATVVYGISKTEKGFSMTTKQDRDNDGEPDDTYYLENKKINKTKN